MNNTTKFNHKALKQARKENGMSINEVVFRAEQMKHGITKTTIINNEQGHTLPAVNTLAIYAVVYNKPISYFFTQNQKHGQFHEKREKYA